MTTNLIKPEKLQVDDLFMRGFALFKSGQYKQSADFFRMVTLLAPTEGRYWISLGHVIRKMGDLDGAIEAFKAALILGQDNDSDLWLTLAECFQDKGLKDKALVALEQAMAVLPPQAKQTRERLELIKKTWSNEVCYE